jgi:hypothetical protein
MLTTVERPEGSFTDNKGISIVPLALARTLNGGKLTNGYLYETFGFLSDKEDLDFINECMREALEEEERYETDRYGWMLKPQVAETEMVMTPIDGFTSIISIGEEDVQHQEIVGRYVESLENLPKMKHGKDVITWEAIDVSSVACAALNVPRIGGDYLLEVVPMMSIRDKELLMVRDRVHYVPDYFGNMRLIPEVGAYRLYLWENELLSTMTDRSLGELSLRHRSRWERDNPGRVFQVVHRLYAKERK